MKNILNLTPLTISKDKELKSKSTSIKLLNDESNKLNSILKQRLKFNIESINSDFEFNGLKIIVCDDPTMFVRELLNNNQTSSKIFIDNFLIKNKNIFHINPFSKVSDFLNSKNNGLLHQYLKNKNIEKSNLDFENFITDKYCEFNDENLEKISTIDLSKASIMEYIDINDEYLDNKNIINILNIISKANTDKQLIIINDYQILDIERIVIDYVDRFDFLIFTNDIRKWINNVSYIECLLVINRFIKNEFKIDSLEIFDKDILLKYLEKQQKSLKKINKLFIDEYLE